jgi:hypothetical protein
LTRPAPIARVFARQWPPNCSAFPDGIPEAIYLRGNPHVTPYAGDHGLRFDAATDAPESVKPSNLRATTAGVHVSLPLALLTPTVTVDFGLHGHHGLGTTICLTALGTSCYANFAPPMTRP